MHRNPTLDFECEPYVGGTAEWDKGDVYQQCLHATAQGTPSRPQEALGVGQLAALFSLAATVEQLSRRIAKLESLPQPLSVPINTFAPKPFETIRPIMVLVEPVVDEDGEPCEYIATFPDGAISVTGDTVEGAVLLLKDRMATQYKRLAQIPKSHLGKIPQQQLVALQAVMRRIE
ncbi:MAG: hypothetical protein NTW96_00155 [Planctomycetia bacterium]|nr:hypothetical protein [Planctomycetia bacterium]